MNKILVIDDDTDICFLLQEFLKSKNFEVEVAYSGETGLKKMKEQLPDVVLCDYRLPDIEGLSMLKEIKKIKASAGVIIITGYSDVKMAVKAIKMGAYEYVTKPLYPEEILHTIENCCNRSIEEPDAKPSTDSKKVKSTAHYIEGRSKEAVRMHNLVNLVAPTNMTCLLIGESGTGKEYVAKRLHQKSKRGKKPFVAVDCGALGNDIAASELFGHTKGAFTGAHADKKGHFEEANGGTLFLDEVGNLSYENQVKLLRVLQERVVSRVGESKSRPVDIRLIAATNADLIEAVDKGEFREDLYHRLNEFKIQIAPLRKRVDDIELFAIYFIEKANEDLGRKVGSIKTKALDKLKSHTWPGNLRELRNVMKRAVLMEQSKQLNLENLPIELGDLSQDGAFSDSAFSDFPTLKAAVEETEKRLIKQTLKKCNFNKSKTAQKLGVDRKTLYNKMDQYNLNRLLQDELGNI